MWRKTIKNISEENKVNITRLNTEPHIKINNTLQPITKRNNKHIYHTFLHNNTKLPTATDTWINIFTFLEKKNWP